MVGRVVEQPDGTLVYTEPTNDKPWYDPYPETPDWRENVRRSNERAVARHRRAEKAIDEFRAQKSAAPAALPSSKPAEPKRSFFSKIFK